MERMHSTYTPAARLGKPGLVPARVVRFSAALSMPVQIQASLRLSGCGLEDGPKVRLDGAVVLAGLCAALSFGRAIRQRRLDEERARHSMMLIPPGEWFVVAAAAARAPIAIGMPCRIQFHDGDGTQLSKTFNLGPYGKEPRSFALSFHVPVAVTVEVTTEDLRLGPRSQPTIGGSLVFLRGMVARCIFPGPRASLRDGPPLVATTETVAVPVGQTIRFPDQLMLRSASLEHLRALSFLDGNGHPLGRFVPYASRDLAGNGNR